MDKDQLANLLVQEGVDLMTADPDRLRRGTPVYVDGAAAVGDVQRLMARDHIRMLPVLSDGNVVGFVDLVDLATMDTLRPEAPVSEVISA